MASSYSELTNVRSLWLPCENTTSLLVVSSAYYWGLRWLFVVCVITGVCHISANSQGTHKCDLTNSYHDELGVRLQNDVALRYSCEVAVSISWSHHDIFLRSNSSLGVHWAVRFPKIQVWYLVINQLDCGFKSTGHGYSWGRSSR